MAPAATAENKTAGAPVAGRPRLVEVVMVRDLNVGDAVRVAQYGVGEVVELPAAEAAAWARAGWAVGTGIVPQADTGDADLNRLIDEVFAVHAAECDADGQLDFFGLERLVADAIFESGEVLVRRRVRRPGARAGWAVILAGGR